MLIANLRQMRAYHHVILGSLSGIESIKYVHLYYFWQTNGVYSILYKDSKKYSFPENS